MVKLKRLLLVIGIVMILYIPICRVMNRTKKDDQMIGVIRIPSIQLELSIYEGVDEKVLQKGIGHIEQTSYPGDGRGSRCLLAGHRGLPNAELFEKLGEIKNGDMFYIEIGAHEYSYEVCDIEVIEPSEIEKLVPLEERELVSLITCTPYCINTHRLIVTGERKK
jgi:sortase A